MVAQNSVPNDESGQPTVKTVKAIPTSQIYAVFDVIEHDGSQVVVGTIGFVDQFGVERTAKTATEKGLANLGHQIVAIFKGLTDVQEPDEATKAELAKTLDAELIAQRTKLIESYRSKSK